MVSTFTTLSTLSPHMVEALSRLPILTKGFYSLFTAVCAVQSDYPLRHGFAARCEAVALPRNGRI